MLTAREISLKILQYTIPGTCIYNLCFWLVYFSLFVYDLIYIYIVLFCRQVASSLCHLFLFSVPCLALFYGELNSFLLNNLLIFIFYSLVHYSAFFVYKNDCKMGWCNEIRLPTSSWLVEVTRDGEFIWYNCGRYLMVSCIFLRSEWHQTNQGNFWCEILLHCYQWILWPLCFFFEVDLVNMKM